MSHFKKSHKQCIRVDVRSYGMTCVSVHFVTGKRRSRPRLTAAHHKLKAHEAFPLVVLS